MPKEEVIYSPSELFSTHTKDGDVWLAGTGNRQNPDIVFIADNPTEAEVAAKRPFSGRSIGMLNVMLQTMQLDVSRCYFTYAVKFSTYKDRKLKAGEISKCRDFVRQELKALNPKVIVPMGTDALKAICTKGYSLSEFRGQPIELPDFPNAKIFPIWSSGYLYINPQMTGEYQKDLCNAFALARGKEVSTRANVSYELVTDTKRAAEIFCELIDNPPDDIMFVDLEGNSLTWLRPDSYVRTLQLGCGVDRNYVFKFYPVDSDEYPIDKSIHYQGCCNITDVMAMFRQYLEYTRCPLGGQNLRFDGHFLMNYGVDVRPYFRYDTMLAEHLINNTGLFSLTDMTLKYTTLGKYDGELLQWKHDNRDQVSDVLGYSRIPDEILFPYAAADVVAPRIIMEKQLPQLGPYLRNRGHEGQYPSLLESIIQTDIDLYEIEREGMPIDVSERLPVLTRIYNDKRREMEASLLQTIANTTGRTEVNLRSTDQVQSLLFTSPSEGGLGLVPLFSTGQGKMKKSWEWVMRQTPEVQKNFNPSTDKMTLELLSEKHPIVKQLLDFRRVDQVCKTFLPEDGDGGIPGNIWGDGKIHPVFRQLTETGRFRTSDPNCQNWSKSAESFMVEIFGGKDKVPKSIRSVVKPPEGWMLIEADFSQAELFVLAYVSGDENMIAALTTPGIDLHTKTAVGSFGMFRHLPDGTEVTEAMAKSWAGSNKAEYEKLESTFLYRTSTGKVLTHSEFKDSIRVAAKAINFGIPYGRGAAAIATQIEAWTGNPVNVQDIQNALDGWKRTYSKAWAYMVKCHNDVVQQGYVESPWGRRRYFPEKPEEWMVAANQREGGNFPIQSTIADTMRLAMSRVLRIRDEERLQFKVVNQIHDALIAMVPIEEKNKCIDALRRGMSGIKIPMPNNISLELGVDIEMYARWGEKLKAA